MEVEKTKFCVSAVSRKLATIGLNDVVQSWSNHPIPGIVHLFITKYCLKCKYAMRARAYRHSPYFFTELERPLILEMRVIRLLN